VATHAAAPVVFDAEPDGHHSAAAGRTPRVRIARAARETPPLLNVVYTFRKATNTNNRPNGHSYVAHPGSALGPLLG
jgi:hypothetical protein